MVFYLPFDGAVHAHIGVALQATLQAGPAEFAVGRRGSAMVVGDDKAHLTFDAKNLPAGEDVRLRIFIDEYMVEVFANDRPAMIARHAERHGTFSLGRLHGGCSHDAQDSRDLAAHTDQPGFSGSTAATDLGTANRVQVPAPLRSATGPDVSRPRWHS